MRPSSNASQNSSLDLIGARGEPGAETIRTPGSAGGDEKTDSRKAAWRLVPDPTDPSPRPDRVPAADAFRPQRAAHPRLRAAWHDQPVRGVEREHRRGDRRLRALP